MIFGIDWVITNPVQTIDSGVKVLFDSEPILASATIITFIIVAFFVWNKNKVKLHRMVHDRKIMDPIRIDPADIKELGVRAKVQAPPQESEIVAADLTKKNPVETEPPIEHPERIDDVGEEPKDEFIDWFLDQYTDDEEEKKEMKKPPETDNRQHVGDEPKIDRRKTPEFKARLLENLKKAREKKKSELEKK